MLLMVLCIPTGCMKRIENFIDPASTFKDIERYIQVGTSRETVVFHFGEPFSREKNAYGHEVWNYFIDAKLLPKDADFAGFSVDIVDGKVTVLTPFYIDKNFLNPEYTFEDIKKVVQIGTPQETVILHFGQPQTKSINEDDSEVWHYVNDFMIVPKDPNFGGFTARIVNGKVSDLSRILTGFSHDTKCAQASAAEKKIQLKEIRQAAEEGDSAAQYYLGMCYSLGDSIKRDDTEAAKWFHKAAEQGHAMAQYNLGELYYYGHGIEKNEVEAVKWFRKAAEHMIPDAENWLGVCYALGQGVEKDEAEAAKWYRKAAEKWHMNAQCNLGVLYDLGQGVEADAAEAVRWYRLAAEQGHVEAQSTLADRYWRGYGVERSIPQATKWWWRSKTMDWKIYVTCAAVLCLAVAAVLFFRHRMYKKCCREDTPTP